MKDPRQAGSPQCWQHQVVPQLKIIKISEKRTTKYHALNQSITKDETKKERIGPSLVEKNE